MGAFACKIDSFSYHFMIQFGHGLRYFNHVNLLKVWINKVDILMTHSGHI